MTAGWSRWDWKPTKLKANTEASRLRKKGYHVRIVKVAAAVGGYDIKVPYSEASKLLKTRRL